MKSRLAGIMFDDTVIQIKRKGYHIVAELYKDIFRQFRCRYRKMNAVGFKPDEWELAMKGKIIELMDVDVGGEEVIGEISVSEADRVAIDGISTVESTTIN